MASAVYNKFNSFVEAVAEKVHNLGSDQLKIALTNTAPTAADTQLSDITEIVYTNLSSRLVTTSASEQTGGIYKLTLADLVLSASGGSVATFRYVVLYNDAASNDELIGYFDYGKEITLDDLESLTVDFDAAEGILTLT